MSQSGQSSRECRFHDGIWRHPWRTHRRWGPLGPPRWARRGSTERDRLSVLEWHKVRLYKLNHFTPINQTSRCMKKKKTHAGWVVMGRTWASYLCLGSLKMGLCKYNETLYWKHFFPFSFKKVIIWLQLPHFLLWLGVSNIWKYALHNEPLAGCKITSCCLSWKENEELWKQNDKVSLTQDFMHQLCPCLRQKNRILRQTWVLRNQI